jgi:hypothetical protein
LVGVLCYRTPRNSLLPTLVRTLRDTFTVKTDDAIQQFIKAFTELKARFRERLNIESWKIACTMNGGVVQLVNNTDRLKELGELRHGYDLTCRSD